MSNPVDVRATSKLPALLMTFLMTMSILSVLPISGPVAASSGRANIAELEPNDDYTQAQPVNSGDIVSGELSWNVDSRDVFKINVNANDILNVSFVQQDYNPLNLSEFVVNIEVLGPLPTHALIRAETKDTMVDSVSAFCVEPGYYFIWIYTNSGSKSVNYTMNAQITTLSPVGRGTYAGHIDATNSPLGTNPYAWYKLSIPTSKGIQVTLNVPQDADFDLFALVQWDGLPYFAPGHKNPLWLNASTENKTYNFEFIKATAFDGTYYLKIKGWTGSKGDYTLNIIDYDPMDNDGDNTFSQATLIDRKMTTQDHLDASFDHFDWYKMDLEKGDTINITMSLLTNTYTIYNLSIYDQLQSYLTGGFDTQTGNYYNATNLVDSQIEIKNFTAPSSGMYYVMVMPVRNPTWWGQKLYVPVESDYQITWDLPNLGPNNNLDIKDISFPEDTEYSGLNLYDHFKDPDGDQLTFSYSPVDPNITVDISQSNGSVVLTPAPNWNTGGSPTVITFRAYDPISNTGKSFSTADAKVSVSPVNDGPFRVTDIQAVNIMEENSKVLQENLYDVFGDIDDDHFTFEVSGNGNIPIKINNTTGEVIIGPASGWYGINDINITAKDSGGLMASANFSVEVSHVNHPPEVVDGQDVRTFVMEEDEANVSIYVRPWFTDIDMGYTTDTMTITTGTPRPKNILPTIDATGFLTIVPVSDWNGMETVWIVAKDSYNKDVMVKLEVTVTPVNDGPIIRSATPSGNNVTINEGMVANFEVSDVVDIDTNSTSLEYTWAIDGEPLKETTSSLDLLTDYDPSSSPLSAGAYNITVTVNDTELTDTMTWTLIILNVNQAPSLVSIMEPDVGHIFKHKDTIVLRAGEAFDMDGDELTYTWKDNSTGEVLGTNQTLTIEKLKKGDHIVLLEVTDGQGGKNSTTVAFSVKGKKKTQPGFETLFTVSALILLVILVRDRRFRG